MILNNNYCLLLRKLDFSYHAEVSQVWLCFMKYCSQFGSMVYKYTKPRGPIAAMYSSPGPCYGLPGLVGQQHHDPRSSHCRGPAYPFGVRHTGLTCDSSPGPCYLPDPKTYRNGRDGSPRYSLSVR